MRRMCVSVTEDVPQAFASPITPSLFCACVHASGLCVQASLIVSPSQGPSLLPPHCHKHLLLSLLLLLLFLFPPSSSSSWVCGAPRAGLIGDEERGRFEKVGMREGFEVGEGRRGGDRKGSAAFKRRARKEACVRAKVKL